MLVVVLAVLGMPVLVVDVVHVVIVLHGRVAAVRTVLVAVDTGGDVDFGLALVVVGFMLGMGVAVVQVVSVTAVLHGYVPATVPVCVRMLDVARV